MLAKGNIYVPLEGYSEEELNELYNFLESINEPCEEYLKVLIKRNKTLEFWDGIWFTDYSAGNKIPITIEQLKEILQPMETLQEKEQRLLKELEEVKKEIEENKIKAGDWVVNPLTNIVIKVTSLKTKCPDHYKKITNPQLIELLENEIK